jgi:hypothetical protein
MKPMDKGPPLDGLPADFGLFGVGAVLLQPVRLSASRPREARPHNKDTPGENLVDFIRVSFFE